jgi:hypothetical protein
MFSIPCIMDQFIKKYQQDVTSHYFISCFVVLYMFRTRSVSIIRRSIKLTAYAYCYRTRCCICSQFYWSPDDGHGTCPKHVENDTTGNKVMWRDILLVFLDKFTIPWFPLLTYFLHPHYYHSPASFITALLTYVKQPFFWFLIIQKSFNTNLSKTPRYTA